MKKTIIAAFAVLAVASVAGAQEAGWNFEGRGAAMPLPVMERVQSAEESQRALAGSLMPQRAVVSVEGEAGALGKMLRQAGRKKSVTGGPVLECEFTGEVASGSELCQVECCLMDNDGNGEPDGTDCHITPFCSPMPDRAGMGTAKSKARQFAAMLKGLQNAKKTRGPYEDCINYCIDAWQDCNGDKCGDDYQRCINVCDNVVNKP